MKNCTTCKFMNFRCKGKCGGCAHKIEDNPSAALRQLPLHKGAFYKEEEVEEKCKCIECYDEDSGKYRYWEAEPELVKYFGGAE